MNHFQKSAHGSKFSFMLWETNPAKRNVNNELKVNVDKDISLKIGDKLIIDNSHKEVVHQSIYEVEEIVEKIDSNIKNKDYYTLKIKWNLSNYILNEE